MMTIVVSLIFVPASNPFAYKKLNLLSSIGRNRGDVRHEVIDSQDPIPLILSELSSLGSWACRTELNGTRERRLRPKTVATTMPNRNLAPRSATTFVLILILTLLAYFRSRPWRLYALDP